MSSINKPLSKSFKPTRVISAAERANKIAKGLCYFCDQPYGQGHWCTTTRPQLFLVEVPMGYEAKAVDDTEPTLTELEGKALEFELVETEPCISLQAISGVQGFQTMRVTGYVGKKSIPILVDSGSIHNFVDLRLAQKLGCKLEPIHL